MLQVGLTIPIKGANLGESSVCAIAQSIQIKVVAGAFHVTSGLRNSSSLGVQECNVFREVEHALLQTESRCKEVSRIHPNDQTTWRAQAWMSWQRRNFSFRRRRFTTSNLKTRLQAVSFVQHPMSLPKSLEDGNKILAEHPEPQRVSL